MIFSLQGTVSFEGDDFLVIDVQGVGYQVFMPFYVKHEIASLGDTVKLFTYQVFREDSQALYGFLKCEDKDFFILLMSVSGIGPKLALKILSASTPQSIVNSILTDNLVALTSISGLGKKTAERMIIELKDKCGQLQGMLSVETGTMPSGKGVSNDYHKDLSLALKSLGYSNSEIQRAFQKAEGLEDSLPLEKNLKALLKVL